MIFASVLRQRMAVGRFMLLLLGVSMGLAPGVYAESGSSQVMMSLIVPVTAENSTPSPNSLPQTAAAQYQPNTLILQEMPLSQGRQPVWIAI